MFHNILGDGYDASFHQPQPLLELLTVVIGPPVALPAPRGGATRAALPPCRHGLARHFERGVVGLPGLQNEHPASRLGALHASLAAGWFAR